MTAPTPEVVLAGVVMVASGALHGWWADQRAWKLHRRLRRVWPRLLGAAVLVAVSWILPRTSEYTDDLAVFAMWLVASTILSVWRRTSQAQHASTSGDPNQDPGQDPEQDERGWWR